MDHTRCIDIECLLYHQLVVIRLSDKNLFCKFINTAAFHLGRHEPSFPISFRAPRLSYHKILSNFVSRSHVCLKHEQASLSKEANLKVLRKLSSESGFSFLLWKKPVLKKSLSLNKSRGTKLSEPVSRQKWC